MGDALGHVLLDLLARSGRSGLLQFLARAGWGFALLALSTFAFTACDEKTTEVTPDPVEVTVTKPPREKAAAAPGRAEPAPRKETPVTQPPSPTIQSSQAVADALRVEPSARRSKASITSRRAERSPSPESTSRAAQAKATRAGLGYPNLPWATLPGHPAVQTREQLRDNLIGRKLWIALEPATRLKLLLQLMERQPEARARVAGSRRPVLNSQGSTN